MGVWTLVEKAFDAIQQCVRGEQPDSSVAQGLLHTLQTWDEQRQ